MVLFHRLRLRWRERRLERKLRSGGTLPTRSPSRGTELSKQRVAIQRLREGDGSSGTNRRETHGPRSTTLDARLLMENTTHSDDRHRVTKQAAIDDMVLAFVEYNNNLRRQEFIEELAVLQAVQLVVPSCRHHVDRWVQHNHESLHIRVRTERDLARWKRVHLSMQDDLLRIRELVAYTARLELVDRKFPHVRDTTSSITQEATVKIKSAATLLPHPEICFIMVVAALVAGLYGLLFLGVLLKLTRKI